VAHDNEGLLASLKPRALAKRENIPLELQAVASFTTLLAWPTGHVLPLADAHSFFRVVCASRMSTHISLRNAARCLLHTGYHGGCKEDPASTDPGTR
jgi:hypothetical protein